MCYINFFKSAVDLFDLSSKRLKHELKPDPGSGLSRLAFTPRQVRVRLSMSFPESVFPCLVRGQLAVICLASVKSVHGNSSSTPSVFHPKNITLLYTLLYKKKKEIILEIILHNLGAAAGLLALLALILPGCLGHN